MAVAIASVIFYHYTNVHGDENTSQLPSGSSVVTSSTLEVTKKTHESDPDLIVSNRYVAEIDGQVVEAPVNTKIDESTAKVTTEVDLTPLVNQMVPDWEIGTGVGYSIDGEPYIPLSVQRNYTHNKAVSVEVHFDPSDRMRAKGIEVQHKWMF